MPKQTDSGQNAPTRADSRTIEASRRRLESWVAYQLDNPPDEGFGRNNYIVQISPRMFELGWDADGIFEALKRSFGLEDDESKDTEIRAAIESSKRYIQPLVAESKAEIARRKAAEEKAHQAASRLFKEVMTNYRWTMDEIREAGGISSWTPQEQTRGFLSQMFLPTDIIWAGMPWESGVDEARGRDYSSHFRTVEQWLSLRNIGHEFISHCTFKAGARNRANNDVMSHRYMVVESDALGLDDVGAIFNWMVHNGAVLRAVVFSGRRSLHGWFDWPTDCNAKEAAAMLKGFQCDPSTMRASQPVRLAGRTRKDTRQVQSLLYLDPA